MGRYKGAIADYDEAICLNPHDPQAYLSRGIVRSELGVKDKARKDCHTALKLAQDANNEDLAARAEQAIENLDGRTLLKHIHSTLGDKPAAIHLVPSHHWKSPQAVNQPA